MYSALFTPLKQLAGIGPALESRLSARGVQYIGDLLLHLPKSYEDDRDVQSIASLKQGVSTRVQGVILSRTSRGYGRKQQVSIVLADDSGELVLNFFHSGYMMKDARLAEGRALSLRGVAHFWGHQCSMTHPDWCVAELFVAKIQPRYASLAGLSSSRLAGFIDLALNILPVYAESVLDDMFDMPLKEALKRIHHPKELHEDFLKPVFRRLQQEELYIYLHVMRRQRKLAACSSFKVTKSKLAQQLLASLPYDLTQGQQQAWLDIQHDLATGQRMHRLLQGDVGCGKTWVAALAIAQVLDHGLQAAMMAPTGVLAQQHYQTIKALLEPLGIKVLLLTGHMKAAARKKILQELAKPQALVCVGTHALISDDVIYANLGLAIVDEQHRFGVKQRWALTEKQTVAKQAIHLLAMTATPIPRSLAMAVYGDMDLTVIQGMPIGRKPIDTRSLSGSASLVSLADGMQRLLDKAGRIYWIVPRIDEDDDDEYGVSVSERVDVLKKRFPNQCVLGLHGRMKEPDKQNILQDFSQGLCQILVSTTVVEVGVNVPEACLIVIDQAQAYGLAQLHQLRGRVGRSDTQSYCILLASDDISDTAQQRLKMMCKSHDGLALAEYDLQLRGTGDTTGTRQSGEAGFRLLDISRDAHLFQAVQALPDRVPVADAMIQFWRPFAEAVD